jgi:hypothetical protein
MRGLKMLQRERSIKPILRAAIFLMAEVKIVGRMGTHNNSPPAGRRLVA